MYNFSINMFSTFCFPVFTLTFFSFFFFSCLFIPLLSSWPSFFNTVLCFKFVLLYNGLEHYILLLPVNCYCLSFFVFYYYFLYFIYLFITAMYYQVISVYQLINNYWLICFIIALKVYLVFNILLLLIELCFSQVVFSLLFFRIHKEVLTFPLDTIKIVI